MKTTLILLFVLIIILITSPILFAQPPGLPASPDQTPVDGGLGILAIAGGAYALKKIREKKVFEG